MYSVVRRWVNTADYWPVRFALTEKIKLRLDENKISFHYPQTDDLHYTEEPADGQPNGPRREICS